MKPACLSLRDVAVGYRRHRPLVSGVELVLSSGTVVGLAGRSGCGKTTLLRVIAGLLPALSGQVDVMGCRQPERAPRGSVAYIPQRLGLVGHASALDNVLVGGLTQAPAWRTLLGWPSASQRRTALEALGMMGLAAEAHDPVKRLSGGQQRRVAIARALVQQPRLLLGDELLGELDEETAAEVASCIVELRRRTDCALLLVDHDRARLAGLADVLYEMKRGALAAV